MRFASTHSFSFLGGALRRLALALALAGAASAAAAQAPPAQNRANAAVTGAPSLLLSSSAANQPDLYIGVQSAGYGSLMLGVIFNVVHRDADCARLRKSKLLQQLGFTAAWMQLLCQDGDLRAAMKAAGTSCELAKETP